MLRLASFAASLIAVMSLASATSFAADPQLVRNPEGDPLHPTSVPNYGPIATLGRTVPTLGKKVIFIGRTIGPGTEKGLWRVGPGKTARLLSDRIRGIDPRVARLGDRLIFIGPAKGKSQARLWSTDGSRAGTFRLRGPLNPYCQSWTNTAASDHHMYSLVKTERHGAELWRTDGTRARSERVTDLGLGGRRAFGGCPEMAVAGGHLFFLLPDPDAEDYDEEYLLWVTDDSAAGAHQIVTGIDRDSLFPTHGGVIFDANGRQIQWTDESGSTSDYLGSCGFLDGATQLGGDAVYVGRVSAGCDNSTAFAVVRSGGTDATTEEISEPFTYQFHSQKVFSSDDETRVFFGHQGSLWTSDGTEAGPQLATTEGSKVGLFFGSDEADRAYFTGAWHTAYEQQVIRIAPPDWEPETLPEPDDQVTRAAGYAVPPGSAYFVQGVDRIARRTDDGRIVHPRVLWRLPVPG